MNLGTLITRPVQDHQHPLKEHGYFTLEVACPDGALEKSGDPKAFAMSAIAAHLASAVLDTGVPKEYWGFEPVLKLQQAFEWPELLAMGVA